MSIKRIVAFSCYDNRIIDTDRITEGMKNLEIVERGDEYQMTYETNNNYCEVIIMKENITHIEIFRGKGE